MDPITTPEKLVPILEWATLNMADDHQQAMTQNEQYIKDVVFYVDADKSSQGSETSPTLDPLAEEEQYNLYKPRPTLKEIAANQRSFSLKVCDSAKDIKRSTSFGGYNGGWAKEDSEETSELTGMTIKDKIMTRYIEREEEFYRLFEDTASPNTVGEMAPAQACQQSTGDGLDSLSKLLCIIDKLSQLKHENESLTRKCMFLQDTKLLVNVQNQILSQRPSLGITKGESFISKASSKMMHYLVPQGQGQGQSLYHRQSSDTVETAHVTAIQSLKLSDTKPLLKRSNSMGSINALDDIARDTDPIVTLKSSSKDSHKETTVRQKVNKTLAKWSKMTKVFSKPETTHKADYGTVTLDELRQVNRKSPYADSKPVPSTFAPPKTADSLVVDPVQSEPHSPCSTSSDPSFPLITGGHSRMMDNADLMALNEAAPTAQTEDVTSLSDDEDNLQLINENTSNLLRRNSSPTLSQSIHGSAEKFLFEESSEPMRRASSFKTAPTRRQESARDRDFKLVYRHSNIEDVHNKAKAAWVKVKDIINTRKDSIKKKSRPRSTSFDEPYEISPENSSYEERFLEADPVCDSPRLSRRHTAQPDLPLTKTDSPTGSRRRTASVKSGSKVTAKAKRDSVVMMPSGALDVSCLIDGVNEDFHKKMKEWEDKKKKGYTTNELSTGENSTVFTEDFIKRMEAWEKKKSRQESVSHVCQPSLPKECSRAPVNVALVGSSPPKSSLVQADGSVAEHLSESFSKTVLEWERIKGQRSKEPVSSETSALAKPFLSIKAERSKSRERPGKDKSKFDKELQKLERKEKMIEKERQKLEKMRQKLETEGRLDMQPTPDFFQRLQDWDGLKGLRSPRSRSNDRSGRRKTISEEHHSRSSSEKKRRETQLFHSDWGKSEPASGEYDREDETGEMDRSPSSPTAGEVTHLDLSLTMDTIHLLEQTTNQLSAALIEKDDEIATLQDELSQMTERINELNKQYSEKMSQYKKDIAAFSQIGQLNLQTQKFENSIRGLKAQLNEVQATEEKILEEKKSVDERILEELTQRSLKEEQLLIDIHNLQKQFDHKAYIRGYDVFDKLYNYVVNISTQVSNLQQGVIKRNVELDSLQHHLLDTEVANWLLAAQLARKDTTISVLKHQRQAKMLKRWKTFHAMDLVQREDGGWQLKSPSRTANESKYLQHLKNTKESCHDVLSEDLAKGLQLPFNWIEGLQKQIREVQDTQTVAVQCQTDPGVSRTCQTIVSTTGFNLPLQRMNWNTGLPNVVVSRGIQNMPCTADAAVLIDDLDIYEAKQRGRKRTVKDRAKQAVDRTVPAKGTVFKRMEIFDPKFREKGDCSPDSRATPDWRTPGVDTDWQRQYVIGRKVLHCELTFHEPAPDSDELIIDNMQAITTDGSTDGEHTEVAVNVVSNGEACMTASEYDNVPSPCTTDTATSHVVTNAVEPSTEENIPTQKPPYSPIIQPQHLRRLKLVGVRMVKKTRRPSADRIMLRARCPPVDSRDNQPRRNSDGASLPPLRDRGEFIPADLRYVKTPSFVDAPRFSALQTKASLVSPIPKLKTVEELLRDCSGPDFTRKRAFSMHKPKGEAEMLSPSPRSLPCIIPVQPTHVTYTLATSAASSLQNHDAQSSGSDSSPYFTAIKRKAFVLETFKWETHSRPRSLHFESEEPHSESIWQRLKPRSTTLPSHQSTAIASQSKETRAYRRLFGRKTGKDSLCRAGGAITTLCMQTIMLDPTEPQPSTSAAGPSTSAAASAASHGEKKRGKLNRVFDAKFFSKPRKFFTGSNTNKRRGDLSPSVSSEDDPSSAECRRSHDTDTEGTTKKTPRKQARSVERVYFMPNLEVCSVFL